MNKPTPTPARKSIIRVRAPGAVTRVVTKLPLPHERDESVGTTGGIASAPMKQAFKDLSNGIQDTDRSAEADRTYKKLKD